MNKAFRATQNITNEKKWLLNLVQNVYKYMATVKEMDHETGRECGQVRDQVRDLSRRSRD